MRMDSSVFTEPVLDADIEEVKGVIRDFVSDTPDLIRESVTRLVSGNAKMLRPAFVVLAGRYGDFDSKRIYALAASVELLHNATLIHDDILDDAETRRGKPAMHTVHGNKLSILVGDYLFSGCFLLASRNSKLEQYDKIAQAITRICEGEILQNSERFSRAAGIRNYKRRIARKTAVLFCLSFYLGAKEAGCSEETASLFIRIGYDIGMAFQIIDDILDMTGDSRKVGKPVGNDLKEGIYTLPVILALKDDDGSLAELLSAGEGLDDTGIAGIIKRVEAGGYISETRKEAELYTERAVREINRLDESYTRRMLLEITESLLGREY